MSLYVILCHLLLPLCEPEHSLLIVFFHSPSFPFFHCYMSKTRPFIHCSKWVLSETPLPFLYLSEDKGLFIVGRVQSVVHHHSCTKLLSDGVCWQPVHVNLNICANFLV